MAQRKQLMGDLSDVFITLPGGIGTMDELFEAWSWTQLGLHQKPNGLLNYAGYYDGLLEFLDLAVEQGFLRPHFRAELTVDTDMARLLERLASVKQAAL
jgi:uncharacterized protein (TIGR00730 family)